MAKMLMLALREPSMGPVFGMKGGATGGGVSILEPSLDIDLHFNGDIHDYSHQRIIFYPQSLIIICTLVMN